MTFGSFATGDTIAHVIAHAFPDRRRDKILHKAPLSPTDVFAVTGVLLQLSGAYHHVQPTVHAAAPSRTRVLYVDDGFRADVRRIADKWGKLTALSKSPPKEVQALWTSLYGVHGHEAVFTEMAPTDACPDWWGLALKLFLAADDAVADEVGWLPATKLTTPWGLGVAGVIEGENDDDRGYLHTIAFETNPDFACVLPKSRTPGVGCTIRSLSQNLALLPPRGVARAYWVSPQELPPDDPVALNLLIVPFPYRLNARSFKKEYSGATPKSSPWGWFDLRQHWLEDLDKGDLSDWIKGLLKSVRRDCEHVHGIIFPELSMTRELFDELADDLKKADGVEFLIAGLSDDGKGRKGNFVATRIMNSKALLPLKGCMTRVREKHHRWRLDTGQISGYALSSALPPPSFWWERLDILSRSIDVFVFRKDSTLTTLICEDLARVDPCQELVRSIGPNLVVALLMDSAQIKERWPARYATVLSEDPGCSVLTLTSRALLDRSNAEGGWSASNAIALWRDDSGRLRSIDAPRNSDAVLLTLAGQHYRERSLDGRESESQAVSWRYHGQQPVRAEVSDDLRERIWSES